MDAALVCNGSTRWLRWQDFGIPQSARPQDLALSAESVWVLFEPSFILRLPRNGSAEDRSFISPPETAERWGAIDADPADGSLWIGRRDAYQLLRADAAGRVQRVDLQGVSGDGGLVGVQVSPEAIHTVPTCADHALWSFSREGELLAASFAAPEALADLDTSRSVNLGFACPRVLLAADEERRIAAFAPADVSLYRAIGAASWEVSAGPFDLEPPGRYTDPAGLRLSRIGPDLAAQYLPDVVHGLFYRHGEPLLLAGAAREGDVVPPPGLRYDKGLLGTVLYRIEGSVLKPVVESCDHRLIEQVESDGTGYAGITRDALFIGSFPP